jgi:hypothetical protein
VPRWVINDEQPSLNLAGPPQEYTDVFQPLTSGICVMCRRCSIYGVRLWASQRFIEQAVRKFVVHAMGTWMFCVWLRALGAKIGSYVTVRFGNALTVPDLLVIGDG